jgi:prepilin-type N-terminal cleavage/methylation domain-containing protein
MNDKKFSIRKQSGFTLVEIAIVLVIIGLLLGGVLKGQEMIENARIKAIVGDINGVTAAYNSYLDRYRAIPGDETNAAMTARGWTGTAEGAVATLNNGVLNIAVNAAFTNLGEQAPMWRALRGAGLLSGDPAAPVTVAGLPRTGAGGLIGVTVGAYGMSGPSVCVAGLTARQAAGIDAAIDGPATPGTFGNATGNARGINSATNPLAPAAAVPANTDFNEASQLTWTMCRRL